MKKNRSLSYKKHGKELKEMYGEKCFYCGVNDADTIDHIVPYSWDGDNSIENLVPSCQRCNAIAGDKIFNSVREKKTYILERIMSKRKDHVKQQIKYVPEPGSDADRIVKMFKNGWSAHNIAHFLDLEIDIVDTVITQFNSTSANSS